MSTGRWAKTDNAWYVLYGMIHMVALVPAGYHSNVPLVPEVHMWPLWHWCHGNSGGTSSTGSLVSRPHLYNQRDWEITFMCKQCMPDTISTASTTMAIL